MELECVAALRTTLELYGHQAGPNRSKQQLLLELRQILVEESKVELGKIFDSFNNQ
jgi:hypothetical protein